MYQFQRAFTLDQIIKLFWNVSKINDFVILKSAK